MTIETIADIEEQLQALGVLDREDVFVAAASLFVDEGSLFKAFKGVLEPKEVETVETPDSSNIRAMEYNVLTGDLIITYKTGGRYLYKSVLNKIWDSHREAASIGSWVNAFIKPFFECELLSRSLSVKRFK